MSSPLSKNGVATFLKFYTNYSADYKMNVLNYMNKTGLSSVDTVAHFNISSLVCFRVGN